MESVYSSCRVKTILVRLLCFERVSQCHVGLLFILGLQNAIIFHRKKTLFLKLFFYIFIFFTFVSKTQSIMTAAPTGASFGV